MNNSRLWLGVAIGAAVTVLAPAAFRAAVPTAAYGQSQMTPLGDSRATDRNSRRTPIVDVVERCRDAVVNISTARTVRMRTVGRDPFEMLFDLNRPRTENRRVESVGSGFVVHESGVIMTNAHVVRQASDIRVTFADGREYPAELVSLDSMHDLAVLRIDSDKPLTAIQLGASDDAMIGETVISIGNPVGLGHTVTTGIVSALGRDLSVNQQLELTKLIQTDAAINPGNSGGPLLNINGELIGVNTAIRGDAQNIGFAIPVARVWDLVPDMLDLEKRQRVALGLRVSGPDAEIMTVRTGSPAARAGVQPRDRLVRLDGRDVRDGIDYYARLINRKPGDTLRLDVSRNGKPVSLKIPLEEIPPPDGAELALRLLGIRVLQVPDKLLTENGVPRGIKLMVEQVERGSVADRLDITRGDFVYGIGNQPVQTLEDLGIVLEKVARGDMIELHMLRWAVADPFTWSPRVIIR